MTSPALSPNSSKDDLAGRIAARVRELRAGPLVAKRDFEQAPTVFHDGEVAPLHAGQVRAWESWKRFVAVYAGWQSGKTVLGPHWLLREMQRKGPGDYAVIVPNYPILLNKALPELKAAFKGIGEYKSGDKFFLIGEEGMAALGWNAPGRILVRHAETEDAIEAFTAKGIWIDEPGQIEDTVWRSIQPRGAVHKARFFFTSRPYRHNWYVKEIWNRVMDKTGRARDDADPNIDVINFKSIENPAFPVEEYERQKLLMPDWEFAMKYEGLPTRPAGAIYDCFENRPDLFGNDNGLPEETNVCKRFAIPRDWPVFAGLDFGNNNTAALISAAEMKGGKETGRHFAFAAYKKAGRTNEEHAWGLRATASGLASQFREAFDLWEKNPERTYRIAGTPPPKGIAEVLHRCHAYPTVYGGSHQEQGWRDAYQLGGLQVLEPIANDVEVGISCGYAGIKERKYIFFDDLTEPIAHVENYSRELDSDLEPTEKIKDKAKWHFADAFRYKATRLFPPISTRTKVTRTITPNANYQHQSRTTSRRPYFERGKAHEDDD